jgi:preprotein translocase subunit SecF
VFDFAGRRWWYFLVSLILVLPGAIALMIPPALKAGIEFTGGASFTVQFANEVDQDALHAALSDLDHPEARIQEANPNQFVVRIDELEGAPPVDADDVGPAPTGEFETISTRLEQEFGSFTLEDLSSISESVSSDIVEKSVYAVLLASFLISVYIVISFRSVPKPWRYGICTILALGHDVLFVVGLFSILGKVLDTEVDTAFITAVLTVAGFSVHDTIVVFDRMREQYHRDPDLTVSNAVNLSLNETLARSLNTTITLVLTIVSLLLIGGDTIRDFLIVLLVGTIVGSYSSIFIASQLLVTWEERDVQRFWRRITGRGNQEAAGSGVPSQAAR